MYTPEIVYKEIPTQTFRGRETMVLYLDCEIVTINHYQYKHIQRGMKTEAHHEIRNRILKRTNRTSETNTNWGNPKRALKKKQRTGEAQAQAGATAAPELQQQRRVIGWSFNHLLLLQKSASFFLLQNILGCLWFRSFGDKPKKKMAIKKRQNIGTEVIIIF